VTVLNASLVAHRDDFEMRCDIELQEGETVALLGPNGAGKSTLVHALAGLLPLDDGEVTIDGDVWERPRDRIRHPPQGRSIGVVFQGLMLFPALSTLDNVAYGPRAQGMSRDESRARAREWLERFDAGHLAGRKPPELSGGEAQRVALARALAVEPALLLLDEPMSALDVENRVEARRVLRRTLADFAGIKLLVTHEPLEAISLADRLVVMEGGRIVQSGAASEIRDRPRTRYTASLVGLNLLSGTVRGTDSHRTLETTDGALVIASGLAPGTEALATIHPRAIVLSRARPSGSARNVLEATVADVDLEGDRVRVLLDARPSLTAEVTIEAFEELGLHRAQEVWASVKATQIEVYPA
jgi:molybdate transport system ATP-binding protein